MTVQEIQEKLDSLHSKMMNSPITNGVTMTEIKALFESRDLIEKQKEIKPIEKQSYVLSHWYCPICNGGLYSDQKYCDECGQKIDWEEDRN